MLRAGWHPCKATLHGLWKTVEIQDLWLQEKAKRTIQRRLVNLFLTFKWNFILFQIIPIAFLLSFPWALLKSLAFFFFFLNQPSSDSYTHWQDPPWAFSSPIQTSPDLCIISEAPAPLSFCCLLAGYAPLCPWLSCSREPSSGHNTRTSHQCWAEEKDHLPQPAITISPKAAQ